jgi:hypothetical protein
LNIFQQELVVKDFMGRRFSQIDNEILADREVSGNQMISDIHVKSFLTRGWGDAGGGAPGWVRRDSFCTRALVHTCAGETPVPPVSTQY